MVRSRDPGDLIKVESIRCRRIGVGKPPPGAPARAESFLPASRLCQGLLLAANVYKMVGQLEEAGLATRTLFRLRSGLVLKP